MAATSMESHERFASGPHLFMESAPVRLWTKIPEGGQLVRRVVIAASTATIVYVLTQLLVGTAS